MMGENTDQQRLRHSAVLNYVQSFIEHAFLKVNSICREN